MKLILLLISLYWFWLQSNTYSQEQISSGNSDTSKDINGFFHHPNIFSTETSYIGDFAGNFAGGNKTGTAYLGMANIKIGLDPKKIGLWNGGQFLINGSCTHGNMLSADYIGDFQVASNIEAGNHIYIHELWYRHSLDVAEITVGLQDLNSEFVTSEFAGLFINSSFGIPSLIADNIPAPIFPLTGLGIATKFFLSEKLSLQAALFDGLPKDFSKNEYNLNWDLTDNDGVLAILELQISILPNNMPGMLKFGSYYHSRLKQKNEETGLIETIFNENYGFYFIADQKIVNINENNGLGLFAQLAFSPGNINFHNYYIGGGIKYNGLFDECGHDNFGLAFAHAGFNNSEDETTIELFYRAPISGIFYIQPDIQYIINPAGTENKLGNALAAFIRFAINF
jgi:porin